MQAREPARLTLFRKGQGDLFAGANAPGAGICRICGRVLTDPKSLKAGIGPVCNGAEHSKSRIGKPEDDDMRSRYTTAIRDGLIVLEDQDQGRSVTNDAELVIQDLRSRHMDLSMPVIYRDTDGMWTGMRVSAGNFAGFIPLRGSGPQGQAITYEEARAAIMGQRP